MLNEEYNKIITEYFDITDVETRKILISIDEADQNQVVTSLASKLYDSIVNKIDDIDCETINQSAGDITKIENYDKLVECLGTMNSLIQASNQTSEPVETILLAMNNIKSRKEMFEKAFKFEIELPIVYYNMITLACVVSTSFMISCCVEFIKSPKDESFTITVDKVKDFNPAEYLMFKNLERFNKSCSNGTFDKAMDNIVRTNTKNFLGLSTGASVAVGIVAGVAIAGLIVSIIPVIRELIFTFYLCRVRISDYFAVQADLLDMNAANIEANSTIDPKKRKEIIKKQTKIASHFRQISNTVEVKMKDANSKAMKELEKSDQKLKIKDVVDKMPDSADTTSLF